MSIPQIVGAAYVQVQSDNPVFEFTGANALPAGAQSYIAIGRPVEHHLLVSAAGWTRQTYWTDGIGAPVNFYYAEASSNPSDTFTYDDYTPSWGYVGTVTMLVIGLDRVLENNWASATSWSTAVQNTLTTPAINAGPDGFMTLSLLAIFADNYAGGLNLPSGWADVQRLTAGPDDTSVQGGFVNTYWPMGVASQEAPTGQPPAATWGWDSTAPSTWASAAVSIRLYGTDSTDLVVTPAAVTATPTVSTVPVSLDSAPTAELTVTPAAVTATPSVSTVPVAMQAAPTDPPFCTSVAPGGRYFLDQYGQPFFWRMECNWFVMARDPSVWDSYLSTRQAQGYTVIEIAYATGNSAEDTDNGIPMFDAGDGLPLDLNQQWLDQVRAFIDAAAGYGITCLMNPSYGWQTQTGWTTAGDFASLLWTNFGDAPNVIWGFGVDYPSNEWSTHNPTILDVISALRSAGETRPVMVQNMPTGKAADPAASGLTTDNADFIGVTDFEFAYAYAAPYDLIRRGYAGAHGPVVLGESNFEQENNEGGPTTTASTLRRQALWTMTCGGVGWDYGHRDIWRGNPGWESSLSTPVQAQLTAIQSAFLGIDWWRLVPDTGNTFLTSGQGVKPSSGTQDYSLVDPLESDYATAAVSLDGSVGVVYVPTGRSFSVNLGKLGTDRTVRRVDPTNGTSTTIAVSSSYTNPGSNAAGSSDWLYIFEAEPFASSGGPGVIVGGAETAATWTVIQGGVEVPIVSWSVVQGGVEVPLT